MHARVATVAAGADRPARPASWPHFLAWWVGGTLGLLLAIAALDVAVDPFFVFGTPLVAGFNRIKPATQGREALAKPALLRRALPRTVLIGTSKVQVGLDPLSAIWPAADRPVFNAGVPGSTHPAVVAVLQDALAVAPLRRAVIFLELPDLLAPAAPYASPAPFRHAGWARARDVLDATLTADAVVASVQTLAAQWTGLPSGLRPDGQMYDGIFRGPTLAEGPGAVFGQKTPGNAARVAGIARLLAADPAAAMGQTRTVRRLVALACRHGVRLDLALAPVHSDFLRMVVLAGLWPRYLAIRQQLARTVAEAGCGQVRLWTFAGFTPWSTEPVPPPGRRAPALRWFWEPNHFRPEYGALLMEAMNGRPGAGTPLTPSALPALDQAQTAAMERDRASQPAEWSRVAAALARAGQGAQYPTR